MRGRKYGRKEERTEDSKREWGVRMRGGKMRRKGSIAFVGS